MRIFNIIIAACTLVLTGCATQAPLPPVAFPGIEQSEKVAINDLRPASESKQKTFSLMVTSSAYGIYRIADSATNPTGMRLLAHRAYEAFPELTGQPTIEVHHFITYANLQSRLRKSALGSAFGGLIGALLANSSTPATGQVVTTRIDQTLLQETADEEYQRAFFTEAENPEKSPVNVIYIETEILGRRIASRSLVPPLADKPNLLLIEALDMCIANHLALYHDEGEQVAAAK